VNIFGKLVSTQQNNSRKRNFFCEVTRDRVGNACNWRVPGIIACSPILNQRFKSTRL